MLLFFSLCLYLLEVSNSQEQQSRMDPISSHHAWCPWIALRIPSEDAMTLLPTSDNTASPSTSPSSPSSSSPSSSTPQQSTASPVGEGSSPGGGGDAGRSLSQKQPAWVLVVRLVAPGLLSQSRRLVQQVKQVRGLPLQEGMVLSRVCLLVNYFDKRATGSLGRL